MKGAVACLNELNEHEHFSTQSDKSYHLPPPKPGRTFAQSIVKCENK